MEHEEETPPAEEEPTTRRYPSTIGGALYLAMMFVVLVGIVVVVVASWRIGIRIFAGALVTGAALRLALPEAEAGMFAVRSKPVDAALYLVIGTALLLLASLIPDQPV